MEYGEYIFRFLYRDNERSYSRGALSDKSYERGTKRSLVSLKMSMISWLIEFISSLLAVSYSYLHSLGLHNLYYLDCIIMNIIIPLFHLMNDEETKGIISEENWYQGVRHMLGLYEQVKRE